MPQFKRSKKDRPYTHEEIHKLLDIADERMSCVILLLSSTGMRVGSLPSIRLRDVEKVDDVYKIQVYLGDKEVSYTFCKK